MLVWLACFGAPGLAAEPSTVVDDALERVDEHGCTPLICAARLGQTDRVRALLARGAAVDAADTNGYTALIWASQEGHGAIVADLLERGAAVERREKHDYTALEWATWEGHTAVVKLLLNRGANPRRLTRWGFDAVEMARRHRRDAILALFLTGQVAGPFGPPSPASPAPMAPSAPVVAWRVLGHSGLGRPIRLAALGPGARKVLFIGAIHGDEPQGQPLIDRLLHEVQQDPSRLGASRLLAIPVANPDGVALGTRTNARGVDLNRNFPTRWRPSPRGRFFGGPHPLSEPEAQVLMGVLARERPALIVSFHADMACNNFDHPQAAPLARAMARTNGYRLLPMIGYETPGSLGQHSAYGLGIPIVTLEVGNEDDASLWRRLRDSLYLAFAPDNDL